MVAFYTSSHFDQLFLRGRIFRQFTRTNDAMAQVKGTFKTTNQAHRNPCSTAFPEADASFGGSALAFGVPKTVSSETC